MVFVPAVRLSLKVLGYRKTIALLETIYPRNTGCRDPKRAISIYRGISKVTNRYHSNATCLHESIFLWWALRLAGVESVIQTGVKRIKETNKLHLHAWVECASEPINESPVETDSYTKVGFKPLSAESDASLNNQC